MPQDDGSRSTVWLVDDSPLEAELSRRVLASRFDVVVFHDAAPMLERLASERPDVLIVDWVMPGISGVEACGHVRERVNSAELPILILTASSSPDDLLAGLAAGANDFVTKPLRDAELLARIASLAGASRLHAKLARAESVLREEATFREKFVAILAHDMRQPLSVFMMGTHLLEGRPLAEADVELATKRFASSSARMARMLDELLDFSRTRQPGGIPMNPAPCDLGEVAGRVVEEVRQSQPNRQIAFEVSGDCSGAWDADRISQVFSNLVGNALDHSAATSTVKVVVRCDEAGVDVSVENECPPIPPAMLATIFDPFRQGPAARKGLGLGLYIVRAIVRAHGGDVYVASDDKSTRFMCHLPRAPLSSAPDPNSTKRPSGPRASPRR